MALWLSVCPDGLLGKEKSLIILIDSSLSNIGGGNNEDVQQMALLLKVRGGERYNCIVGRE